MFRLAIHWPTLIHNFAISSPLSFLILKVDLLYRTTHIQSIKQIFLLWLSEASTIKPEVLSFCQVRARVRSKDIALHSKVWYTSGWLKIFIFLSHLFYCSSPRSRRQRTSKITGHSNPAYEDPVTNYRIFYQIAELQFSSPHSHYQK